jgi:hypothetical protein
VEVVGHQRDFGAILVRRHWHTYLFLLQPRSRNAAHPTALRIRCASAAHPLRIRCASAATIFEGLTA